MRTRLFLAAASLIAAAEPAAASLIQRFAFGYSIPGDPSAGLVAVEASGVLTARAVAARVTAITGQRNGEAITGLVPPGGFGGNDNLLLFSDPRLTINGLTYTVAGPGADGDGNVNVYSAGGVYLEFLLAGETDAFNITETGRDTYAFGYKIPGTSDASGTLTAITIQYEVIDITGTRNGEAITGLLPPGSLGGNNNFLFTEGGPVLDILGLGYTVAGAGNDGLGNVNVYHTSSGYTELDNAVGFTENFTLTPLETPVPAPATLALFGLGAAALGLARRRSVAASAPRAWGAAMALPRTVTSVFPNRGATFSTSNTVGVSV